MTYKPTNMTTEGHTTFQGPSPNDQILLEDLLSTEKYISGFHDTAVFESADPNVWQAPQHIQHDEQVMDKNCSITCIAMECMILNRGHLEFDLGVIFYYQ